MGQHPIKDLIDQLFPNKSDEKRANWAKYDDISELIDKLFPDKSKEKRKVWAKGLPIKIVKVLET